VILSKQKISEKEEEIVKTQHKPIKKPVSKPTESNKISTDNFVKRQKFINSALSTSA